jgi:hypothetical protein
MRSSPAHAGHLGSAAGSSTSLLATTPPTKQAISRLASESPTNTSEFGRIPNLDWVDWTG